MVDQVAMTIHVTPEERQQIEELAHEHGYDSTEAYLLALVNSDAQTTAEDEKQPILDDIRQGLREIKAGLGRPISELGDELKDDD
jgi:predicted transcriptional regulator